MKNTIGQNVKVNSKTQLGESFTGMIVNYSTLENGEIQAYMVQVDGTRITSAYRPEELEFI